MATKTYSHTQFPRLHGAPVALRKIHRPFEACKFPQTRHRALRPACTSPSDDAKGGDGGLSSVFNQFVFIKGIPSPDAVAQRNNPSPLISPSGVLEQVMTVLQRNDWPEPDSGVTAAFHFTLPAAEGQSQDAGAVRSWRAAAEWLPWPRFHALLHVSYGPLLNCDSWRVISPLVFPSNRHDNKAVQAVEVRARPRPGPAPALGRPGSGSGSGWQEAGGVGSGGEGAGGVSDALRSYTYTFCLERQESGAFKDCWLITGVRTGNYAL